MMRSSFHQKSRKFLMPAILCFAVTGVFAAPDKAQAQVPPQVVVPVQAQNALPEQNAAPVQTLNETSVQDPAAESNVVYADSGEQNAAPVQTPNEATVQDPAAEPDIVYTDSGEQTIAPALIASSEDLETELVETGKFEIDVNVGYAARFQRGNLYDDNAQKLDDGDRPYKTNHGVFVALDFTYKFTEYFALNAEQRIGWINNDDDSDEHTEFYDTPLLLSTLLNLQFTYEIEHFAMDLKLGIGFDYAYFAMNAGLRFSYIFDEHWSIGLNVNYTPALMLSGEASTDYEYAGFSHTIAASFNFAYRF